MKDVLARDSASCCTHLDEVDKLVALVFDKVIKLLKVPYAPLSLLLYLLQLCHLHFLDARHHSHVLDLHRTGIFIALVLPKQGFAGTLPLSCKNKYLLAAYLCLAKANKRSEGAAGRNSAASE
jgi:hypothetical protein